MEDERQPDAEGVISKKGAVITCYARATHCYFRPETEELVFIAPDYAGSFENHWRDLLYRMNAFHQACGAYFKAASEYYVEAVRPMGMPPLLGDRLGGAVRSAEAAQAQARQSLLEKLGGIRSAGMHYDDVVELIPLDGDTNCSRLVKYAYVKKEFFQSNSLNMCSIPLGNKSGIGTFPSIYNKDEVGVLGIDKSLLVQQLSSLNWFDLIGRAMRVMQLAGSHYDSDVLRTEAILFDWAEKWNDSLQMSGKGTERMDISAAAQFMRFTANAGAQGNFDVDQGTARIKGEGETSLTIASGRVDVTLFLPDRLGWSLSFSDLQGRAYDLGMFRVVLKPGLYGHIGASVLIEGQGQIVLKDYQQLLAGLPDGKMPSFFSRREKGAGFINEMGEQEKGLDLSGEVLVGASLESRLEGSLQWVKPVGPATPESSTGLKNVAGQYVSFCKITSSIAGLVGVGAGKKLSCTYVDGKFCFHVAASLCWGTGAKGRLVGYVDADSIVEFGNWLVTQLYWLNFKNFAVVTRVAFKAYLLFCVKRLLDLPSATGDIYRRMEGGFDAVVFELESLVSGIVDDYRVGVKASQVRNELARNVISRPQELLMHTPEAKGLILYLLTSHNKWDIFDSGNFAGKTGVDFYGDRKEAVICVLKSVQTRDEWHKVLVRISRDGERIAEDDNERIVSERQQRFLVDFLRVGSNRDEDLYQARRDLLAIRARLKLRPARGYALAMNHSIYYALHRLDNPLYTRCFALGADGEGAV